MESSECVLASSGKSDGLPTSRSLIERAKHHDDQAWQELVDLYTPLVYFWCRQTNVVEQDVADVVQDVFRAVVSGLDGFRKDRPCHTFRGWLRTVTRSKLTDHFRRKHRNPTAIGGTDAHWRMELVTAEPDDEDCEERLAEQALFRRGLEKIRHDFDPKSWQAFWRVVVDGLSASEAGAELGMRPGTVRVAKSRVLQRLRRQLGDVE